ncbi:MAG: aspartate-semialdehyde dehydrogenase [Gammaproteobacteria bacterium]
MKKINIAVIGATGAVGSTVIEILAERKFPINILYPLASKKSVGKFVHFKNKSLIIHDLAKFDFSQAQIAFFAAGSTASSHAVEKATKAGCIVIDKSSLFRMEADIPLIIPEVNPAQLSQYKKRRIIATPNCVTIPMAVALKPIYDAVGIERINIISYQSVSGAGNKGIKELVQQTAAILNCKPIEKSTFPHQIAFNVIPQIDDFCDNGYTKEEMKIIQETQKIFSDPNLRINVTAVRVPVFYGHSMALHIETRKKITAKQASILLKKSPGIILSKTYPTPVSEINKKDGIYIGRIREDISHPHGLNLWVMADNVRKGAALNAVQIAEMLIDEIT